MLYNVVKKMTALFVGWGVKVYSLIHCGHFTNMYATEYKGNKKFWCFHSTAAVEVLCITDGPAFSLSHSPCLHTRTFDPEAMQTYSPPAV